MREQLEQWIGEQRGVPVEVAELRRITTGHSAATGSSSWGRVALRGSSRTGRRVRHGGRRVRVHAGRRSARVPGRRGALAGADGKRPRPAVLRDGLRRGRGGDGSEDRSLAPELAVDFVRRLDELHRLDWTQLQGPSPEEATHVQIERWADVYRSASAVPIPLLEEGAAWLHHHAPALQRVGVVHGDPGPGNFVHDGRQVLAFTDWEFTHLGDPTEDWSFLLSMRGSRTMSREDWLTLIRDEVGVEVRPEHMRYWQAFNFFKGACANRSCASRRSPPPIRPPTWRSSAPSSSRPSCVRWPT